MTTGHQASRLISSYLSTPLEPCVQKLMKNLQPKESDQAVDGSRAHRKKTGLTAPWKEPYRWRFVFEKERYPTFRNRCSLRASPTHVTRRDELNFQPVTILF